uniref:Uncharacterized protein n=1 Tax=Zea mays TaxID=4577 RepID=B7ZXV8_MAIZE|nr:unknown [Zea mays]
MIDQKHGPMILPSHPSIKYGRAQQVIIIKRTKSTPLDQRNKKHASTIQLEIAK